MKVSRGWLLATAFSLFSTLPVLASEYDPELKLIAEELIDEALTCAYASNEKILLSASQKVPYLLDRIETRKKVLDHQGKVTLADIRIFIEANEAIILCMGEIGNSRASGELSDAAYQELERIFSN